MWCAVRRFHEVSPKCRRGPPPIVYQAALKSFSSSFGMSIWICLCHLKCWDHCVARQRELTEHRLVMQVVSRNSVV